MSNITNKKSFENIRDIVKIKRSQIGDGKYDIGSNDNIKESISVKESDRKKYLSNYVDSKHFEIKVDFHLNQNHFKNEEILTPINMPFENMFINLKELYRVRINNSSYYYIYSILIKEIKGCRYLVQIQYGNGSGSIGLSCTEFDYNERTIENFLLRKIMSKINESYLIEEDLNKRIPFKIVNPRDFINVDTVIYCKNNHSNIYYDSNKVNWLHRWSVRGHWRKVSGFGHDRYGNKIDTGFTWVKNHIKGCGSFKEKTRDFL